MSKTTFTTVSWKAIVEAEEAKKKNKERDVAYRFSNGREFLRETDPYAWAKS